MEGTRPHRKRRLLLLVVGVLLASCAACAVIYGLFGNQAGEPESSGRSVLVATNEAVIPVSTDEPTNEPTATPLPTPALPTAEPPTTTPAPTATTAPIAANLEIVAVNDVAEYVDIRNATGADVMMTGWVLFSERGEQSCPLDGVGLFPAGETLRVLALAQTVGPGEFSCGFDENIWNNDEPDAAILIDPAGVIVSRR